MLVQSYDAHSLFIALDGIVCGGPANTLNELTHFYASSSPRKKEQNLKIDLNYLKIGD